MGKPGTAGSKKRVTQVTSFRLNESDWKILEKIQEDTGITSATEVVRMALRALERERAGGKKK